MSREKNTLVLNRIAMSYAVKGSAIDLFAEVSLRVEGGESVAITGASGIGKSTLLALAAGLQPPTAGEVSCHVDDQRVKSAALRKRTGFIYQSFHLLPELDTLNNVALPLRLRGDKAADKKAAVWLDRVGLSERSRHRPQALSGGEQQRAAVARALVSSPAFIFADEPTGNLDETTAGQVADLIFDNVRREQSGLLLVTHSRTLAARADRQFVLEGGSLHELPMDAIATPGRLL